MVSDTDIAISGKVKASDCHLPSKLASDVLNFFSARYSSVNETTQYERQRKIDIANAMKKFDTYFMLEPGNESSFVIMAALILEPKITFANGECCTIIHLNATAFEKEESYQMKTLLYHVFSQTSIEKSQAALLFISMEIINLDYFAHHNKRTKKAIRRKN